MQKLILAQNFGDLGEVNGLKTATLLALRIKKANFKFNLLTFLLMVIHIMQEAQKKKKKKEKKRIEVIKF